LRRSSIALLILAITSVGLTGCFGSGDEEPEDPDRARTEVPVSAKTQWKLAKRFRPLLRFDSRESWRPVRIPPFLAETGPLDHTLCRRNQTGRCPGIKDQGYLVKRIQGDPNDLGKDLYIDLSGVAENGRDAEAPPQACLRKPGVLDCNGGPTSAIYYQARRANGRYYVSYWWFFRYNDYRKIKIATQCDRANLYCGDHEGDWEGITVVTNAEDRRGIEYVTYAEHSGNFNYAPTEITLKPGPDGKRTRPVAYVADGTHATYPASCTGHFCWQLFPVPKLEHLGLRLPEGRSNGAIGWDRNPDQEGLESPKQCLIPLPDEVRDSWNAFNGQWGRYCKPITAACPVNEGPATPSNQSRNIAPWCFLRVLPSGKGFEKGESCDVQTPGKPAAADPGEGTGTDCRAWAGADVAILACDQDELAASLSQDETAGTAGIEILLEDGTVGETKTRGISHVVRKPLHAPFRFIVRGKVTEVLVRARAPDESLIEARFPQLELGPDDEVAVEVRQSEGRANVFMQLPDGTFIEPETPAQIG
jgi:hypothetical protein